MIKAKDFFKDFKLSEDVYDHMVDVTNDMATVVNKLQGYSEEAQYMFLMDAYLKEKAASSRLERVMYIPEILDTYGKDYTDNVKLTKNSLLLMHKDILKESLELHKTPGEYRKHQVWIGNPNEGIEHAFHVPPQPEEIPELMEDFLEYFNDDSNADVANPIVKSALAHVLFIKIHPFADGNGRMARMLQNYKLVTLMNEQCGTKFPLPFFNLSSNYDLTRTTYFSRQNDIKYEPGANNNKAFNKWLDYVLTMYDEQIFYLNNRIGEYNQTLSDINSLAPTKKR